MKVSKMIELALSYVGYNEADGSHKVIIDRYNTYDPLPVNYKVKYTDPWCATFVSSLAIELDYIDFPVECSCPRMIKELKRMGCWEENDAYYPHPGDLIFYDWSDWGIGDNHSEPDHVGIVQKTIGRYIYVIEGNYHKAVGIRKIEVNGRFIRGYGKLIYDKEIQVGEEITFQQYEYKGIKVEAIAKGLVIYDHHDEYVVDMNDKIVCVKKESLVL